MNKGKCRAGLKISLILVLFLNIIEGCKRERINPLDPKNPNSDAVALPSPSNLEIIVQPGFICLTWDVVEGATNYRIYRNDMRLTTVGSTYYHDIDVVAVKTYTYYVTAIHSSGLEGYRSEIVSATYDIYFGENFDDDIIGGQPDNPWQVKENNGSYVRISPLIYYGDSGNSCVFFDPNPDTSAYCYIYAESISTQKSGIIDFVWRVEDTLDNFGFRAGNGSYWDDIAIYVLFMDGELKYSTERGVFNTICPIRPCFWYRMRLEFDYNLRSYDIFVNDTLRVANALYFGTPDTYYPLEFLFVAFSNTICKEAYIDNIVYHSIR